MRIVGGQLSGRRFASPKSKSTRATSERVREGIASALQSRNAFAAAHCLDLYAGTGAYAFEAISRGAATAVSIDRQADCVAAIAKSAAELGIADQITVLHSWPSAFRRRSVALTWCSLTHRTTPSRMPSRYSTNCWKWV